jgi:uncharacterized membrane protein
MLLLYGDERRDALAAVGLSVLSNAGLSLLTFRLGPDFNCMGYLVATLVSSLPTLSLCRTRLRSLKHWTFMLQPIAGPSE